MADRNSAVSTTAVKTFAERMLAPPRCGRRVKFLSCSGGVWTQRQMLRIDETERRVVERWSEIDGGVGGRGENGGG